MTATPYKTLRRLGRNSDQPPDWMRRGGPTTFYVPAITDATAHDLDLLACNGWHVETAPAGATTRITLSERTTP